MLSSLLNDACDSWLNDACDSCSPHWPPAVLWRHCLLRARFCWSRFLEGPAEIASSGALSEHDLEEINAMSPQDQAMRLLEKAVNQCRGAGEEIAKRADGWVGQIRSTPELESLTNTAYFSSDLRVCAAAHEIWLARDSVGKRPETVDDLIRRAAENTKGK